MHNLLAPETGAVSNWNICPQLANIHSRLLFLVTYLNYHDALHIPCASLCCSGWNNCPLRWAALCFAGTSLWRTAPRCGCTVAPCAVCIVQWCSGCPHFACLRQYRHPADALWSCYCVDGRICVSSFSANDFMKLPCFCAYLRFKGVYSLVFDRIRRNYFCKSNCHLIGIFPVFMGSL